MPRILSLTLFVLTLLVSFAPCRAEADGTVVVLQSLRTKPYDAVFDGFKAVLPPDARIHRIILHESSGTDAAEVIRAAAPDLVFAVGVRALSVAESLGDMPVVYAMVLDTAAVAAEGAYTTGVGMEIAPERQLAVLKEVLPRTRTVGLLYDPKRSGALVRKIQKAAERKRIALVDEEVIRPRSVPLSGMEMMREIDVFWMLPDLTVITPENTEFLFLLAMESRIPILTFSEKYVGMGALLSIGVDPYDMGRQSGDMARKILAGADVRSIPRENARKGIITVNRKIADKLGITFDESVLKQVRVIE